jgi:hypothetical protein
MSDLFVLLQALTNLAIVGTFVVYWRLYGAARDQINAAQKQLEASREATRTQSLLTAITFLQQDRIHEARSHLIAKGPGTFSSWDAEERRSADIALGTYDIIAILCRRNVIPTEVIVDNWGDSIINCREKAFELVAYYRFPAERGPAFWDDLDWLYTLCKARPLWKKDAT